jgi:hypothetical protein
LERSQVIDLIPERSADSFARWLGLHPFSRDFYAAVPSKVNFSANLL